MFMLPLVGYSGVAQCVVERQLLRIHHGPLQSCKSPLLSHLSSDGLL